MPEQYKLNPETISKYENAVPKNKDEERYFKKLCKVGQKITDNVNTKLGGVKTKDPEFWGLREVISERECDIVLKRKQRKWYTFDELYEKNKKEFEPLDFKNTLDQLCVHGLIEYDYGDHYDDKDLHSRIR